MISLRKLTFFNAVVILYFKFCYIKAIQRSNLCHLKLDGKNPISFLQELCLINKWPCPVYDIANEFGPPHSRSYLMKVTLNNASFQPATHSNNKKLSKAQAAFTCLQSLGYFKK